MDDQQRAKSQRSRKVATGVFSAWAGAALVVAGFRYSQLNWIVDGPGWIVSRFMSIDFHEGDGALGFLFGVLLAWLLSSTVVFYVVYSGFTLTGGLSNLGGFAESRSVTKVVLPSPLLLHNYPVFK